MTGSRLGIVGASSVVALLLAITVGASNVAPPVPHYAAPAPSPAGYVRVADLFGESDEEKAARQQHEDGQDSQIRSLSDKVRDLEDSVRTLTGQNEELSHRVTELNDKIDRQQKDFEYRLCALAAQQLGTATGQGDPNAIPCPGSGPAAGPALSMAPGAPAPAMSAPMTVAPRGDSHLAPPPGVLGTLPAGSAAAAPGPGPGDDAARDQFSSAMNLLAKARYDDARAAFRAFADANPQSDLTPQAVYWVGDIAYVQKDYDNATRAFAEVIKKYPTSVRAPDSMLKLGQALIAAGQKKEGCTALAALPAKYPKASKSLLAQGSDARKAAACRAEA
ncbi:MAG: tol-pal system protein YbgF [Rhizomicrobium sp.]